VVYQRPPGGVSSGTRLISVRAEVDRAEPSPTRPRMTRTFPPVGQHPLGAGHPNGVASEPPGSSDRRKCSSHICRLVRARAAAVTEGYGPGFPHGMGLTPGAVASRKPSPFRG
jgi:hypothetical protein